MSAGTAVPDAAESVGELKPSRRSRRSAPDFASSLLRRDVFGVRLGVLLLILPVILAGLGMQLTSRQGWNHPPDSRYYVAMMARDVGYSWSHSIHAELRVQPDNHLSPWYFADNDPTWQMVRTRLLYPVLSVPFIWMWGLSGGSMAVPVLGTVLFLWATARLLQRLYGPAIAVIVAGGFSLTVPVNGFTWAGTDTLALGLAAVLVLNLPIERRIGKANLVWIGAASIFIALTRQVGVLAPAMAGAGWLWLLVRERQWRNRWLGSLIVTAATTFLFQVLSMTLAPANTAGVIGHGETSYWGIFREFVHYLRIVTEEACTYMWHNDRMLYALFIAAGISVLARFKSDATAVFVGAVGATYVITAGVGFSGFMRYEMVMFPAAAVAAGQLVQLALGDHVRQPVGAVAELEPAPTRTRTWFSDRFAALALTKPGRFLGLNLQRQDRWKPQLLFNSLVLAIVIGVSLDGSWSSTVNAPASPSYAAAQGGSGYAVPPLAKPSADQTLRIMFAQAIGIAHGSAQLQGALDWTHAMQYRPMAPDQPGWPNRAKDGTAVVNPNSMGMDIDMSEAYGRGLSLNSTVKPDSVKILSRQVSEYGEDVVFTVEDTSGKVHQGTATTLYPIWHKNDPATVTALVFDA
ncbi:hypothetical protein Caci_0410 [Catenulispora acidiphila DSM 44928]|uniref:Uncharacterized protein n=1 Tax=Catenulispora acidiphila (strain DSM 44928 / JCM 14897 / NBRC 102108 / NRRL B-24433 / ID139908) TaxID=479433 RepID=C7PVK6_CATAD|nr:hypothetical protein [Catenulispora acidiphila]ACU69362.1 hypothetical protein Caci_0410 [Catenulispora acidiphila DSM 44928]